MKAKRYTEKINDIISKMTLEEKASLCSGLDFFRLKGIERLEIPTIMLSDGPHGLRKHDESPTNQGAVGNVPATCFPTASATASSWDRRLLNEIGVALGEECQAEDISVILGPGANIKRSPLCGRNFEYISEDPFLTGEMAVSIIDGIQSQGVGTSLKHFAVNNQEYRRVTIDAIVDERALREIYLPGFERAVKKSQPWTVMCSYNRVNGTYASEHKKLLNDILRDEWGFEGIVVTDWGACNDRIEGLKAGQNLEMPYNFDFNDTKIINAVQEGSLDIAVLDNNIKLLLELMFKATEKRKNGFKYDKEAHHKLARHAASESMVLLKNESNILPIKKDAVIALVGAFAKTPRFQGCGSSLITPTKIDNAYDVLTERNVTFKYAVGYEIKNDMPDEKLIGEACSIAKEADVVIVLAGLTDAYESEGMDREHMRMPESHNSLIKEIAKVNPNTVVVLSNGAPVEMPWVNDVKAVLESFLSGQAGASAVVDVLFGDVNPSGKLSETFPIKLSDNPSYKHFPAGPKTVEYRESIYVGYRYYDTAKKAVLFPFGHGLSYTTFEYSGLKLSKGSMKDYETLKVSINVKNTGKVAGSEVVQLYVRDVESTIFRPEKELKGFEKVFLVPEEEKRVEFTLDKRSFAYYNIDISDWHVESGEFEILVAASSADIRAGAKIFVESTSPDVSVPDYHVTAPIYYNLSSGEFEEDEKAFETLYGKPIPANTRLPGEEFTINSVLGDIKETTIGRKLYNLVIDDLKSRFGSMKNDAIEKMIFEITENAPIRGISRFSKGRITPSMLDVLVLMINNKDINSVKASDVEDLESLGFFR